MKEKIEKMRNGKGFIAALDQSGGSTPKALKLYGVEESAYKNDAEMFDLIHQMRTRIIKSPASHIRKRSHLYKSLFLIVQKTVRTHYLIKCIIKRS